MKSRQSLSTEAMWKDACKGKSEELQLDGLASPPKGELFEAEAGRAGAKQARFRLRFGITCWMPGWPYS